MFSLAPVVTRSVPLIAVGFFVAGAVSISCKLITVSIRRRIFPNHLLGRVNAGYRLLAWGTRPLGGAIASTFGITTALITSAVISSLCAPIVYFGVTRDRLAEADPGNGSLTPLTRPQVRRAPRERSQEVIRAVA